MKSLILILTCLLIPEAHAAETASPSKLSDEGEAGVVIAGGNSETTTVSFKNKLAYSWADQALLFDTGFLRASSQGIEQANQWNLGVRYEHSFTQKLGYLLGQKVERNAYQGIEQRYSSDLGAKYSFEKSESLNWRVEAGYRFNRENYSSSFRNFSFARLYHEIERKFTPTFGVKWWVEFLPNLTESTAYQANTELSLLAALNETFSMKNSYLYKYNHAPPAGTLFRSDSLLTTSIVAKF